MKKALLLAFGVVVGQGFLKAADLGVHGAVFPIQETSLLDVITNRVNALKKTGKLGAIQKNITSKARQRVFHPQAVHQLPRASEYQSFVFDPSFVLPRDYKDHKGVVFARKGESIKPLETYSWGQPLLLINGDDQKQVHWIKTQKGKIVLTQGSTLKLEKHLQRPVYFDQGGRIVTRFGIIAVPAKISQQDKHLLVEMIPPALIPEPLKIVKTKKPQVKQSVGVARNANKSGAQP